MAALRPPFVRQPAAPTQHHFTNSSVPTSLKSSSPAAQAEGALEHHGKQYSLAQYTYQACVCVCVCSDGLWVQAPELVAEEMAELGKCLRTSLRT